MINLLLQHVMQRPTTCKSTTSLCFSGACVLSQHWGRWSSLGLSPPGKIYQFWLPVFKPFLRYWSFDKSDIPALPILRSLGRTFRWLSASVWASKTFKVIGCLWTYMFFRYHTGTLAFGSLIIAIIKMIRLMLQYIQDKLEEKGADNPVVKVCYSSLQSCKLF